jgi:hypothetical protein
LQDYNGWLELLNLLGQQIDISPGRKSENAESIGILTHDIQCVRADRAGRTKYCERTSGQYDLCSCAIPARGNLRPARFPDHIMLDFSESPWSCEAAGFSTDPFGRRGGCFRGLSV